MVRMKIFEDAKNITITDVTEIQAKEKTMTK